MTTLLVRTSPRPDHALPASASAPGTHQVGRHHRIVAGATRQHLPGPTSRRPRTSRRPGPIHQQQVACPTRRQALDHPARPATWPRNRHPRPLHDVPFRVVAIDGAPHPAPLAGRKDTVYLPPGRVYRLALTFTDHTDHTVPYMFHCHLLWDEDLGMMGQFVVVGAGRRAAPAPAGGHPHHHD